jgi:histidinol-phosphate/aromatic aminotransferase/cobyric acid decarboxylase-like protein
MRLRIHRLPSVVAAIVDAANEINRYPDPFTTHLIQALSDKFAVPLSKLQLVPDRLAYVSKSSSQLLAQAMKLFMLGDRLRRIRSLQQLLAQ